jgi:hypothetical protein
MALATQKRDDYMAIIGSVVNFMPRIDRLYVDDRLARLASSIESTHSALREGSERWAKALGRVWAELPKRGWYLSGHEPSDLIFELSAFIVAKEWDKVDEAVLSHLPTFKPKELREWMQKFEIPDYCVNRLSLFLAKHDAKEYEMATYLGIPLIDEISQYFYKGKSLTTKRASNKRNRDQSKPEIAIETAGSRALERFHKGFVQTFGSLQEDPNMRRLSDENYWNRHAILHGMMKRSMGEKDSAKCLMAIAFLICAFDEEGTGAKPG